MKRLTKQFITQKVNEETGELMVVETEKHFNINVTTETFTMIYNDYLHKFYGLQHVSDLKLITKFCEIAEFNTGKVVIAPSTRDEICEELSISKPNLSKNIKRLKENGLITGDRGTYMVDPKLFWKGDRKVREKLLKEQGITVTLTFRSDEK